MKVVMEIELELDDNFFGSEPDEIEWLKDEIVVAGRLVVHSNEIGDHLGEITKITNLTITQVKQ